MSEDSEIEAHYLAKIVLAPSDSEYLDQLIPVLKSATISNRTPVLQRDLKQYAEEQETEIEKMCNQNHQDFLRSVRNLQDVRSRTSRLTEDILGLNQSIQSSTEKLAEHKKALVDSRGVRQNMDEAAQAMRDCLEVLRASNHVNELLAQKNHYGALRALDELQNVHLKKVAEYKVAEMIQASVPATQKQIADAVMNDLNTWLFRIRETSSVIGEIAFYHTGARRERQRVRREEDPNLREFKLNSGIELVMDESESFDVLDNDEVSVDFTPLFECLHIHEALGQSEKFRTEYSATRKKQKELLIPSSITLLDVEEGHADLTSLLEGIAGFGIIEKATMRRAHNLRSPVEVDELWDSMCQSVIHLVSKALSDVDSASSVLAVKNKLAEFAHTMDGWGYSVSAIDAFLLDIFEKYAELLKKQYSDILEKIVTDDDYMPMPIGNYEDYDNILEASWYTPDKPREELTFPCVLPFSQMYPACCIDIRNFLNYFLQFLDDNFQHKAVVDQKIKKVSWAIAGLACRANSHLVSG